MPRSKKNKVQNIPKAVTKDESTEQASPLFEKRTSSLLSLCTIALAVTSSLLRTTETFIANAHAKPDDQPQFPALGECVTPDGEKRKFQTARDLPFFEKDIPFLREDQFKALEKSGDTTYHYATGNCMDAGNSLLLKQKELLDKHSRKSTLDCPELFRIGLLNPSTRQKPPAQPCKPGEREIKTFTTSKGDGYHFIAMPSRNERPTHVVGAFPATELTREEITEGIIEPMKFAVASQDTRMIEIFKTNRYSKCPSSLCHQPPQIKQAGSLGRGG